jgi:hypothetical protein
MEAVGNTKVRAGGKITLPHKTGKITALYF